MRYRSKAGRAWRGIRALAAFLVLGGLAAAHEVTPLQLVFAKAGEKLTVTVADCCTCQANIQLVSNDTSICVVDPPASGSGISVSFTVTAVAPGETTLTASWQGFGTDSGGFPCTDTSSNTVNVAVFTGLFSSGNTKNSAKVSDPVNSFAGEFYLEESPDVDLGGPIPVHFQRYYGSHLFRENFGARPLGKGWLHTYDFQMRRKYDGSHPDSERYILVVTNKGRILRFEKQDSVWILKDKTDVPWRLVQDGNAIILGDPIERRLYRFNVDGLLTEVFDTNGNSVTLAYTAVSDGVGLVQRLTSVTDGLGRTLTLAYNAAANLASVTDGARTRSYTVPSGRLASYTDAAGHQTTYSYDTSKPAYGPLLTSKLLPRGNTPFINVYDASGRIQSQSDAAANGWTFAYAAGTTTVTDPMGHAFVHAYDAGGQLTGDSADGPRPIDYTYDASGRISGFTGAGGGAASLGYGFEYHAASGNPSRIVYPDLSETTFDYVGRSTFGITFYYNSRIDHPDGTTDLFTYDSAGNVVGKTDRLGNAWTSTHNPQGHFTSITLPTGGVYTFNYNADGTLVSMEDPAGNATTFGYDAKKRLVSRQFPDLTSTAYTYDSMDNLLTFTNEAGGVTTFTYDANGNLSTAVDTRLNTTEFVYDAQDRLIGVTAPNGSTASRSFDELGRLSSVTDRSGNTTSVGYDPVTGLEIERTDGESNTWTSAFDENGYIESLTDPLGRVTLYETNYLGQISRVQSPRGAVWQLDHDAFNRLSNVVDPLGQSWNFDYDKEWRLTSIGVFGQAQDVSHVRNALGGITQTTDSLNRNWLQSYDNQGRIVTTTDPLGNTILYSHNSANRIDSVTYPGGLGTQTVLYAPTGEVSHRVYSDATDLTYSYDSEGALTASNNLTLVPDAQGQIVNSNGLAIVRDEGGRVQSVTYGPGKTVTYTYDARDLPVTVTDWVSGVTTLQYDALGQMTQITRPNGETTTYTYNNDGEISGITDRKSGGALVASIALTPDLRGQTASAVRALPLAANPPDEWAAFTYNNASQTTRFSYDALGRLINDGSRTYTWDLAGRLASRSDPAGSITYEYDGIGKMVSRTQGAETKEYVWNYGFPLPVVATVKKNGAADAYYVYTPYGQLLHRIEASSNARRYYHFDEAGNTIYLTNQSAVVTDQYATTPYGVVLDQTGTTDNPFVHKGLQGAMRDGDSNLYYMRARFYDASTARFLSRDPFNRSVSPLETNPYSYARANPLMFGDPLGFNAKVIYDGGIHTDIAVDIWCGDQIVGTLTVGFFATGFVNNNLTVMDSIGGVFYGAPSTIKGQLVFGPSLGPAGVSGNTIVIPGSKEQDERLARQLLQWINIGGLGPGVTPGDIIKGAFPLPKGQTTGAFPIKVNSTSTYGGYRTWLFSQVCNNFTDDALDVYYGEDWYTWPVPFGHFGSILFNGVKAYEERRHVKPPLSDIAPVTGTSVTGSSQ